MLTFEFSILTPDGKVYQNHVESIVAPGVSGHFGVLANHASMIAATSPGILKIFKETERYFVVGNGIVEVSYNQVNFLADSAEQAKSYDDAKLKASLIC